MTGFVGKVVLEKLFYEFPDIGRIYVIVRGKKGVSVKDRFDGGVCMSPIWKVRCRPKGEDDESFVARIHEKVQVVQVRAQTRTVVRARPRAGGARLP